MKDQSSIEGADLMGNNLRDKIKYCGEGVRLVSLCKMIHPQNAELDDYCQIMDFACWIQVLNATFLNSSKISKGVLCPSR